MHALYHVARVEAWTRQLEAAEAHAAELIALAEEKSAEFWRALGTLTKGSILSPTDRTADAIELINAGAEAYRSTGSIAASREDPKILRVDDAEIVGDG